MSDTKNLTFSLIAHLSIYNKLKLKFQLSFSTNFRIFHINKNVPCELIYYLDFNQG